jgi:excisionase family DNA binding protein
MLKVKLKAMTQNFTTTFTESELSALIEGAVNKFVENRPNIQQTEIINRNELCKRLSITEPTVIRWEKKGKIPVLKIGRNVRYNWIAVIKSLEK